MSAAFLHINIPLKSCKQSLKNHRENWGYAVQVTHRSTNTAKQYGNALQLHAGTQMGKHESQF